MISSYYDKNGELLNDGDIVRIDVGTIEYGNVNITETMDYIDIEGISYPLNTINPQSIEKILDAVPTYDRHKSSKKMKNRVRKRMAKRHSKRLNRFNADLFVENSKSMKRIYCSNFSYYKFQKKYSNRIVRRNDNILLKGNDYKKYAGYNSDVFYWYW